MQFGVDLTPAAPGSAQGLLLAVSGLKSARRQLAARGIEASEVFHCATGTGCRFLRIGTRVSGPHPSSSITDPLLRSVIRMATDGCCRKSHRGFLGVLPAIRRMRRCTIFPRR